MVARAVVTWLPSQVWPHIEACQSRRLLRQQGRSVCFFESCVLNLQEKGINVTIIHPGFIKTPLTAGVKRRCRFCWNSTRR